MRVLITGAAGFVGSHLSEACLARGWTVTGVDSFTDFYDPAVKRGNLEVATSHSAFRLIDADLAVDPLEPLLEGVDVVFHLAAQAGVRASWGTRFDSYTNSNVIAMQRLLEASKDRALHKFVFASSSSVYGDAEQLPTTERATLAPLSPYGATKVLGEHLGEIYPSSYGVPFVTLRFFSVYGPRQRPDMAFWRLIDSALNATEMTVFGDGRQTRDFTYVEDIVAATIAAGDLASPGSIYNVGGGSRMSLIDTIEIITAEAGSPHLVWTASQRGDARDTAADTSKLTRELELVPQWTVARGLAAQVEWQKRTADRFAPRPDRCGTKKL